MVVFHHCLWAHRPTQVNARGGWSRWVGLRSASAQFAPSSGPTLSPLDSSQHRSPAHWFLCCMSLPALILALTSLICTTVNSLWTDRRGAFKSDASEFDLESTTCGFILRQMSGTLWLPLPYLHILENNTLPASIREWSPQMPTTGSPLMLLYLVGVIVRPPTPSQPTMSLPDSSSPNPISITSFPVLLQKLQLPVDKVYLWGELLRFSFLDARILTPRVRCLLLSPLTL